MLYIFRDNKVRKLATTEVR